ncbi:hypothetical protein KC19_VG144800 [Ceratodon purpureus]|uniref:Endonuclease/exonuclease/phosphatase domain-containing protein n=1 Tax=Ceratodon purpureus TaxID=3225 RepID=A0A8T0HQP6_CERPU|nr:hypothetical protein KC19_VG144800 [Ceratodon purpureus]
MIHDLAIATHNIRAMGKGIVGIRKRCDLRDFYRKATPQPQVILLQEHHMSLEECFTQTQQIHFKGGICLWNNATFSAESGRFKGGTGIIMSRHLAPAIQDSGVIIEATTQYVILEVNDVTVGILNLYAPNTPGTRAVFWAKLAEHPWPDAEWVVCGDFNMTENEADRSPGYTGPCMGRRELGTWTRFAMRLGITDAFLSDEFRKIGGKRFTWSREEPRPAWSRIDRCYIDPKVRERGGKHGIWSTMAHLSDHAPVFLEISFRKRTRPP